MSGRALFLWLAWAPVLALAAACSRSAPSVPAPAAPAKSAVEEAEELLAEREARTAASERSRPASAPESSPTEAVETLTVCARLIDEHGEPLLRARLEWLEPTEAEPLVRAEAAAESSGAVWLVLARSALPAEGPLLIAAHGAGRASEQRSIERARFATATMLNLGEWTLLEAPEHPATPPAAGTGPKPR